MEKDTGQTHFLRSKSPDKIPHSRDMYGVTRLIAAYKLECLKIISYPLSRSPSIYYRFTFMLNVSRSSTTVAVGAVFLRLQGLSKRGMESERETETFEILLYNALWWRGLNHWTAGILST
jgi:hypothetical protein